MMDSTNMVTAGGLGTGVAAAALIGLATRRAAPALAGLGAGALVGGVATHQLQNVAERYGIGGFSLASKPSVALGVTSGALGVGAITWAALSGSTSVAGTPGRIAAAGAGALFGAAAVLSALNGLDIE